jgi:GxxExxY protein
VPRYARCTHCLRPQVTIPIFYKGAEVGGGFKADVVVSGDLILKIKAVSTILPIHAVQLRPY